MGLVLTFIVIAFCIGFAVLFYAMIDAPEANEDSSGFSLTAEAKAVS